MRGFKEFVETDPTIKNFLKIGLVSGEMAEYYESISDSCESRSRMQQALHSLNKDQKILKRDPEFTVQEIGSRYFLLKRGRGVSRKRPSLSSKKTYRKGDVFYSQGSSPVTRMLFEMNDSDIRSVSLRILNTVGKYGEITEEGIIVENKIVNSNSHKKDISGWISNLCKSGYVVKEHEICRLGVQVAPCYSPEIREIWKDLRDWPFRKKFYP